MHMYNIYIYIHTCRIRIKKTGWKDRIHRCKQKGRKEGRKEGRNVLGLILH
jgi:hypothetical protein